VINLDGGPVEPVAAAEAAVMLVLRILLSLNVAAAAELDH
jgi:hypothetical protein